MSFANKVVLVTGGNSGMGLDTVKHLVAEGAKVYFTGRNEVAVRKVQAELGASVVGIVADAASIADSITLAETIAQNGDKLDGVFINAGIAKFLPIDLVDEAHFDEIINTNFKGPYFTIQKLLPVLRDGASIVLNGSSAVHVGSPSVSIYSATKAALNSLAKTLSRDLLPRRIRVNVVNPGSIATPLYDKLGFPEEAKPALVQQFESLIPVGRQGTASEITGYVAFLLSDKSSFILGTELTIDGGMTQL